MSDSEAWGLCNDISVPVIFGRAIVIYKLPLYLQKELEVIF